LSGIKLFYAPADLVGKQVIIAANLAPRTMMGVESRGMVMLANDGQGKPQLVSPVLPVPDGTRLS
jgi:methionyl-tRNA synthetase